MYQMLEHSEIWWIERTGYPSCMQEDEPQEGPDEDELYEEYIQEKLFGDRGE